MRKETIESLNVFRIALGAVFCLLAGCVLYDEMILAFLLLLIGIGFLSGRIEAVESEAFQE